MPRLIDANAFAGCLERMTKTAYPNLFPGLLEAIDYVKDFPTVDAVEVVRCKDCKHWVHMEDGMGDCTNARFHLEGHVDPTMEMDGFCSLGERKDNG